MVIVKKIAEKICQRFKDVKSMDVAIRLCDAMEFAIFQVLKEEGEVSFPMLGKMYIKQLKPKNLRLPNGTPVRSRGIKTIRFKANWKFREAFNKLK